MNATNTYATQYAYDGNGNLTNVTDALANVRAFTYDGLGRRLTAQDLHASGDGTYGTWTYTYDDAGNLTSSLDPKGQTVNYAYDDLNRPTSEDFDGQVGTEVTNSYDSCQYGKGRLCTSASASATSTMAYGPTGQATSVTKTIGGTGYQTDTTHDRQGNVVTATQPDGSQVQNVYNGGGLLEKLQHKESGGSFLDVVRNFDWSPVGKPAQIVYGNGATTTNTYDASRLYRLTRKQTTIQAINVSTSTSTTSATTTDSFDATLNGTVYKQASPWSTAHNASVGTTAYYNNSLNGTQIRSTNTGTPTIRRGFVVFDTSSIPDNATATAAIFKVYVVSRWNLSSDPNNWVTVVKTNQASDTDLTTDDYNKAGLNTNPVEGVSVSGRKNIAGITTGQYLNFTLNATGTAWVSATGTTMLGIREGHDAVNSNVFLGTEDGIKIESVGSAPILQVTYTAPVTTSTTTTTMVDAPIQDVSYSYDAAGNITRIVDAGSSTPRTTDYGYDSLNRLTSASTTAPIGGGTKTFAYDAIGNITNRSDVGNYAYASTGYANPHAATTVGSTTYAYDNDGNLSTRASDAFAWDYRNRLLSALVNAATTTYAYDNNGDRVQMTAGATSTAYASDWYSISNGKPTKHIFAGGVLVATIEGSTSTATVHYVATDHLTGANVVMSSTGTVEEATDYNPYGDIRVDSKSTPYSEVRKFAGHEYDVGTGLSYMGARYYDASLGRFLSQDPVFVTVGNVRSASDRKQLEALLSDPQQLNSYSYARNNPLVYVDPDGNFAVPVSLYNAYMRAGDWGNKVYASNSAAAFVMDHPYVPAAVGAAPLAAYGAVAAAPAIASAVGNAAATIGAERGIRAGVGAGLNVTSTYLSGKIEGRDVSGSEYAYSAVTGAGQGVLPGGWIRQGIAAGAANWYGQAKYQGDVDPFSVGISAFGGAAGSAILSNPAMTQVPNLFTQVTGQAVGWTIDVPGQTMNSGIQRSVEEKRKRK